MLQVSKYLRETLSKLANIKEVEYSKYNDKTEMLNLE